MLFSNTDFTVFVVFVCLPRFLAPVFEIFYRLRTLSRWSASAPQPSNYFGRSAGRRGAAAGLALGTAGAARAAAARVADALLERRWLFIPVRKLTSVSGGCSAESSSAPVPHAARTRPQGSSKEM